MDDLGVPPFMESSIYRVRKNWDESSTNVPLRARRSDFCVTWEMLRYFSEIFWFMKGIQKIDIWLWLFFWTRTAWWFGTWILFFPYIGRNFIISTDFHIFQRGRYTTNQRNAWHVVTLSVRHPCPMSPKKTETWRFLRPGTLGRVKNRFGKPERFEMMRFEI